MLGDAVLQSLPAWVEPPTLEPGSRDPLGFQLEADRIADRLLPGITVQTNRARYLSFLCWAIDRKKAPAEIDHWEVAIAVREYRKQGSKPDRPFLGVRLVTEKALARSDPVPRRLHKQTARILYGGLLSSCGLGDMQTGELTAMGEKLARNFGLGMPEKVPARAFNCDALGGLSEIGARERRELRRALLEEGDDAQIRRQTVHEITKRWLKVTRGSAADILRGYLPRRRWRSIAAKLLHEAALLELKALPLTALFLHLYRNEGKVSGRLPLNARLQRAYEVDPAPPRLLNDVAAHLRHLKQLGGESPPLSLPELKRYLLWLHLQAKPDSPWVNEQWRVLRRGMGSVSVHIHPYRLPALYSLLLDVGEIA